MEAYILNIQNMQDVKDWFSHLLLVESIVFHPDYNFSDYTDEHNAATYTPAEVIERDNLLNTCFTVCDRAGADIYDVAAEVFQTVNKNQFAA